MAAATLKYIVLVLIALSAIWFIRVVVKRETENLLRSALLIILLLAAFIYLQGTKAEKITWAGIKQEVKDTFFPEKPLHYIYHKDEGITGNRRFIRFFFESPGPRLSLVLDSSQKYFHIKSAHSVNRILEYIGLEKIKAPVPELASITGSRNDLNLYRWDDYPKGTLMIERGICQDRDRLESYQCIVSVTVFLW
jgi:hypothetical protein